MRLIASSFLRPCAVLALISAAAAAQSVIPTAQASAVRPKMSPVAGDLLPSVGSRRATVIGPRSVAAPMDATLGLSMRRETELDRFIAQEGRGQAPMSQSAFDRRFGADPRSVRAVLSWVRAHGLRVDYRSPDGLIIEVSGTTGQMESALDIREDRYRLGRTTFYANRTNPILPTALGIQTIVGLNSFQHPYLSGLRRLDVRNPNGYLPKDLRAAYDVSQHHGGSQGQTIGFTLFDGSPVTNADLSHFGEVSGDPSIRSCAVTTSTGTPASCRGSHAANTIQWVEMNVNKQSLGDMGSLPEIALDVEYGHGIAPDSHLKYFIGNGNNVVSMLSAAASDHSLHLVSNSWGETGITSASDDFVRQTATVFKKALAVGTTFLFATGDQANNSGCDSGACNTPSYPADSPYVLAVGGTDMQMNSKLTAWSSETTWNNFTTEDSDGSLEFEGGGSGCASYLGRPAFQKSVSEIAANATCSGRAIPDVAADADNNESPVEIVVSIPGQPSVGSVGGTSLASPLWAGMLADAFNFEAGRHRTLSWKRGWLTPQLYKLAESRLYQTYFHDIVCGYDGSPAAPGWDQATGWGSPDWFKLANGLAGLKVSATGKSPSGCRLSTSLSTASAEKRLELPFADWPAGAERSSLSEAVRSASWLENTNDNYFRQFHSRSYSSFHVLGNYDEQVSIQIESDTSPNGELFLTYYPTNTDAARVVSDAVTTAANNYGIDFADCSNGYDPANSDSDPTLINPLTPDCWLAIYPVTDNSNVSWTVIHFVFAIDNTVGEAFLQAQTADLENDGTEATDFQNDALQIASAGVSQLTKATDTHDLLP